MSHRSCSNCLFFASMTSECRRCHPSLGADGQGVFPITKGDLWCGEFRPLLSFKLPAERKAGRPSRWSLQMVKDALAGLEPGRIVTFPKLCDIARANLKGIHRNTVSAYVAKLVEENWLTRTIDGYSRAHQEEI